MEYTKGEWKVVEAPNGINQLPRLEIMAFQDNYERNVCRLSVRAPEEELANAHLIAAAPDCHRELKNLVTRIEQGLALGEKLDLEPARQALAKAEMKGGTHA